MATVWKCIYSCYLKTSFWCLLVLGRWRTANSFVVRSVALVWVWPMDNTQQQVETVVNVIEDKKIENEINSQQQNCSVLSVEGTIAEQQQEQKEETKKETKQEKEEQCFAELLPPVAVVDALIIFLSKFKKANTTEKEEKQLTGCQDIPPAAVVASLKTFFIPYCIYRQTQQKKRRSSQPALFVLIF